MDRQKQIKGEVKRLGEILPLIPENKQHIATKLIENIAFMGVTLADLQAKVNEEGSVIVSKTGNGFDVMQENPAQKAYNSMIKNFNASIKELNNMLPDNKAQAQAKAGEALQAFISKGK